mmetsp:Transcript_20296/g.61646  ORF Transcript_20296/g.61646 Transcript_20296/m.61646 type:complete len:786 (-) Transcript_20296:105-2462(-)|eukprot:CAMPEP_0118879422 /NCGR_PEP_ID=MMETSP1163-20130328/19223_1 /TAXON_ID=124430 /ORGANISM="Phaeomonas parva, Strain CCMP2877" /LENGTH=785 /DNA_ID=CAMNT_0006815573 /DNA_START=644 /DNA_END=3001 /DNA_ORIENTATION=-
MMNAEERRVGEMLDEVAPGLDDTIRRYLSGMLADDPQEAVTVGLMPTVGNFFQSLHVVSDEDEAEAKCAELTELLEEEFKVGRKNPNQSVATADLPKLLAAPVKLSGLARREETEEEKSLRDSIWGLTDLRKKYNLTYMATDKVKPRGKAAAKARKQRASKGAAEDLTKVSTMRLPNLKTGNNDRTISVENINLAAPDGTELLDGAELKFAHGRRYGLVGKNGVGKTTLLKAMANFDLENFPTHLRVLHVRQEVAPSEKAVVNVVMEADVERNALMDKEAEILERQDGGYAEGDEGVKQAAADDEELQEVYARLEIIGAESAEARARMILAGLQFTEEQVNGPTSALSGGWRMRVSLAAALLIQPDVLLLDEPTNHLDLEAVIWLQNYLVGYPHTLLVVSHDRAFLNEVVTDIVFFNRQKLEYFRTDYDHYEKRRAEKLREQKRIYEAHMAKRQHMQEFVDKFRANAKRASLVQSRIKAIEKMDREGIEDVEEEKPFRFTLPNPESLGRPIIAVEGVSFGYPLDSKPNQPKKTPEELEAEAEAKAAEAAAAAEAEGEGAGDDDSDGDDEEEEETKKAGVPPERLLFHDVHFGVDLDSRMVLVGANGAGKSTLLNLILSKLRPVDGEVHVNPRLRIGVFTQHATEAFDMDLSAVENMMAEFKGQDALACRGFLGRFQISGEIANRPMGNLSGGQKSRVAFAFLTFRRPHVVIMDEPTNHLDMDAIEALVQALKEFRGGVLAVSHDRYFIENVCREMWVVDGKRVSRIAGGYDEYRETILKRIATHN